MIRLHFTFNKDKMAEWLTRMDREGWKLRSMAAGFCSFDETKPGTYDYQVDYAGVGNMDPDYISLLNDLGVQIVCKWGPWVVLRRAADAGPFQLYTDAESRVTHLKKVLRFFKIVAIVEILCAIYVLSIAMTERSWILLVIGGLGLAAAIGMIVRGRQLRTEINRLCGTESGFVTDRMQQILLAAACAIMAAGFIADRNTPLSDFLVGMGFGLMIVFACRAVWRTLRS